VAKFAVESRIDVPKARVWEVLSNLGSIYKWNPGVTSSHSTSESGSGEGATRHCDISNGPIKGYLEERALDWREGEGFKIDIYDTNLPLKSNVVEFSVRADGESTVVTVSPEYTIKFGIVGKLMDALMMRRQMRKGMEGLLAGLKYHVETGNEVGNKVPAV